MNYGLWDPKTQLSLLCVCKLDSRVSVWTYRCSTPRLSQEFLLHGLFIKPFTPFYIDSTMLNKIADKKRITTLQELG